MNAQINREYKDSLFRKLFGNSDNREYIISLYNALNNTNYSDDTEFEITTLEDVIYVGRKNDVSLLINSSMPLWEHQSTYNPNMPLRGLLYYGNLYNSYIESNDLNLYGSSLVKIPTPQYIVFYNGEVERESITELKLSDAFIAPSMGNNFEWTATVYNLNKGKNDALLSKCKPLNDYMTLINYVREYKRAMPLEKAVRISVERCISEGILKDLLTKAEGDVLNLILNEFNEEKYINDIKAESFSRGKEEGRLEGKEEGRLEGKEEGRLEGKEEGRLEGSLEVYFKMIKKGKYTIEEAASELGLTVEEISIKMKDFL